MKVEDIVRILVLLQKCPIKDWHDLRDEDATQDDIVQAQKDFVLSHLEEYDDEKIIEPLKVYRGGDKFIEYCEQQGISLGCSGCGCYENLYYISNREVVAFYDTINKATKLLIDKGFIIEVSIPRWRAKEGNFYWFIRSNMKVERERDERDSFANILYDAGNYFASEEEAEEKLKEIKEILNK